MAGRVMADHVDDRGLDQLAASVELVDRVDVVDDRGRVGQVGGDRGASPPSMAWPWSARGPFPRMSLRRMALRGGGCLPMGPHGQGRARAGTRASAGAGATCEGNGTPGLA